MNAKINRLVCPKCRSKSILPRCRECDVERIVPSVRAEVVKRKRGRPLLGEKRIAPGERRRERRAAYLADKCCNYCLSTENLEIDHIDPSTKVASEVWTWSEERRNAELAKCQVLCERCHMVKTKIDMQYAMKHDYSGYHRGCRCNACKAGHSEVNKRYAAKARAKRLAANASPEKS